MRKAFSASRRRKLHMTAKNFWAKATITVAILSVMPLFVAAQELPELPNPGSPQVSREQQEQLGLKAMAEVYKQMPVLPDSQPVAQYVQRLGKRLVAVMPAEYSWPYQFHVVQSKDINAFALPGGPIFINLGTIQAAQNEAELAGVMAHEISHVYMQHSAKAMPKQQVAQLFAGVLGAVLPGSTAGNLARLGIQFGAGSLLLKYSRTDEAQADAVGAIIMYKEGFNPQALAEFFKRLEKESDGSLQFLSNHPNPGNREQAISREISNWPPKDFVSDSPAFANVKQNAKGSKTYSGQEIADGAKQGMWLRYNQERGSIPRNLPVQSVNDAPGPQ
jgi:beta-barrel assembly-enhancing protease